MSKIKIIEQLKQCKMYRFYFEEVEDGKKQDYTTWMEFPNPHCVDERTEKECLDDYVQKYGKPHEIRDSFNFVVLFKKENNLYRFTLGAIISSHNCKFFSKEIGVRENESDKIVTKRESYLDWDMLVNMYIYGGDTPSSFCYSNTYSTIGTEKGRLVIKPARQHLNSNTGLDYQDIQNLTKELDFKPFGIIEIPMKEGIQFLVGFNSRYYTGHDNAIPRDKISSLSEHIFSRSIYSGFRGLPK